MGLFSPKAKDPEKVAIPETTSGNGKKATVFDNAEKAESSKKDSTLAEKKKHTEQSKKVAVESTSTQPGTPKRESKKKEYTATSAAAVSKKSLLAAGSGDEKLAANKIAVASPEESKQRTKSSQPSTLFKKETNNGDEKRSRSKSDSSTSKVKFAGSVEKNEEKEVVKNVKPVPKVKTPETILTKPDESRIPTRHAKKSAVGSKTIEQTLLQMGTLKTRLKLELKSRPNKQKIEELNMDNFDFADAGAIKEKMMEMHKNNMLLKKQVSELNSHNSTLQNRLLKEQEKGKLHPKVTTVVPTSLEANMHLRYQFQKNLEKERKKYAQLLLENERLALEVKEANLENLKKRKTKTMETSIAHNNEMTNWKVKVRELELDNLQLLEIITKREQEMAKVVKEKEFIYKEMVTMRRLHMHLSNRIDNMDGGDGHSSSESQELSQEDKVEQQQQPTSPAAKSDVPHYAQRVKRENELKLRAGNKKLLASKGKAPIPIRNKTVEAAESSFKTLNDPAPQIKPTQKQPPVLVSPQENSKGASLAAVATLATNVKKIAPPANVNKEQRNPDLTIMGEQKPVTPAKKSRSKSETPSKPASSANKDDAAEEEKENMTPVVTITRTRASSEQPSKKDDDNDRKLEQMKNAKIQIEYESYVPSEVKKGTAMAD